MLYTSAKFNYIADVYCFYDWTMVAYISAKYFKIADIYAKTGYNQYIISTGKNSPAYLPDYSKLAVTIMDQIAEKYPFIAFTVFETVLMNEFLNHLVAQNTIFVQAEKDILIFCFSLSAGRKLWKCYAEAGQKGF